MATEKAQHIQETFDRYCIEDLSSHIKGSERPHLLFFMEVGLLRQTGPRKADWTEESSRRHIRPIHPAGAIPDAAITTPPSSTSQLSAASPYSPIFRYHELLGTRELDWYWRESNNGILFRAAGLAQMFRSIAGIGSGKLITKKSQGEEGDVVDSDPGSVSDVMDVLVMIGPQYMHRDALGATTSGCGTDATASSDSDGGRVS
ncbi:hypothetical protein F5Y16DRAFT_403164 [Xylariaceae sp. FL0255]|nr:hypothetical protein F5Y16DRAFT_403164 [Xylariaceae sp. FL0255]